MIAGGGTGGHVIPALAIGRELRERFPAGVSFVGTPRGLETRLVPEAGFPLHLIEVGQLKNVSLLVRARTLADLPLGLRRCLRLLRTLRPHAVVGVGGYASGPAMLAAILLRIPTLAYEPNAAPGFANRAVGRWVTAAAVAHRESRRFFRNAVVTGVPVRPEFFALPPSDPMAAPRLLVFGGSQGAQALNRGMASVVAPLLATIPGLSVVHQAGARHAEETQALFVASGADPERWRVRAFLDAMPAELGAASLVLCRSGSSVAELAAAGRPSVLVPFPRAADDHQRKNAEAFVRAGAASILLERDLTPERLLETLASLLTDQQSLMRMGAAARQLARPEALRHITDIVVQLAGAQSPAA